jgi:hypothetical protein
MNLKTKPKIKLTSTPLLKITALIFGYIFWLILAQEQMLQTNLAIPISFYMPQETGLNIAGPSQISVHLLGKRIDLQKLDLKNIGAHIDTSHLKEPGNYQLPIASEHIFLPNYVKMLYYTPVMINIEISKSVS